MKKSVDKRKLLSHLILGAAAVILGFSLYFWNSQDLLGDQMPMPFGYGISVVLSGSMEPALRINDLAIIRETDEVEEGEIIVYQRGSVLVIHRVLEIIGDTVITKGDANNAADAPVSLSDIKGVMVASIPGAGAVVQLIKHPAAAAVILLAAVMLTELSFRKDKKKDKKELESIEDEIRKLMTEIKDESK